MNQKEKSKISQDKILNAALAEFGTQSYENASLNNICNDNNISKGLIYHYFENKDELYLHCVRICFEDMVAFLSHNLQISNDFNTDMKAYIDLRYRFFSENPYYSNIFFNIILQPPKHLVAQIKELRSAFDELNISYFKAALNSITLRDNFTQDEAINYFLIFQEMFNGYYQSKVYENSDLNTLMKDHEIQMTKLLNIILYGMAKE